MTAIANIRSWVSVRPHPTVVRLDALEHDGSEWIADTFVRTPEIRRHLDVLERLLASGRGGGVFLIGHYGSGKSHFLAHLVQQQRAAPPGEGLAVVPVSLINFSAANRLEDIVAGALGIDAGDGDRRPTHDHWLDAHPRGAVLVIDELSEFLRAKDSPQAFNEDVRYLQFLGEWAQAREFWIVAAMQESIEHTGELEYSLYRKIKDRYPIRLLLTPAHVESLICDGILVKHEGYAKAVERLADSLYEAVPEARAELAALQSIYPLHPATLVLLEEVRDRFSQARGIVDFVVTRLAGDPTRGIEPFLDRPWGELLTPDVIVDHFHDLLALQPEFLPLAQQLFPWYERHLDEIFERASQRELADKLLKLLILVHLSPSREQLSAADATTWLLFGASRLDPARNLRVVTRILDTLATQGRYVAQRGGAYRLNLGDDGSGILEERLHREMAELRGRDELILETLAALLQGASFNPVTLPRESWQHREVAWHFHPRRYAVWLGEQNPPAPDVLALCIRLPWGESAPAPGLATVVPGRIQVGDELVEFAAMARLAERPLGGDISKRLDKRIAARLPLLAQAMRNAWLEADIFMPDGRREAPPRLTEGMGLEAWLAATALWLLRRTYPAFERFAPGHGPLAKEAWRRFMADAMVDDPGRYEADDYVKLIREAYLVPMGLLRRSGRDYTVPANLEKHELVALLTPLLDHDPTPKTIYAHLAEPIYGLVPDQVSALLLSLLLQGVIDLVKGGRSYRECYETLPDPRQYDRVVPGHALAAEQIQALERLCDAFAIGVPKQWTVLAQRRSARRLRELAERRTGELDSLATKLEGTPGVEQLVARVRHHRDVWSALVRAREPLDGLVQFLQRAGGALAFSEEAAELGDLHQRLPRLLSELQRFRHLAGHPALANHQRTELGHILARVGEPPPVHETRSLEEWLDAAARAYAEHKESYRAAHERWWKELVAQPVWGWRPPPVARSRHLALDGALERFAATRREAERLCCHGLVNLDYQPMCACGFDGEGAPVTAVLARLTGLRGEIEGELERFFAGAPVRKRMVEWQSAGLDPMTNLSAYLDRRQPYPEVGEIDLLDKHLAGLALVKEIDARPLLEMLQHQVWERASLRSAVDRYLANLEGERVRLRLPGFAAPLPESLIEWCAEHCLVHGSRLPAGLGSDILGPLVASLRPLWVSGVAVERLDDLGLPEAGVDRVLGWLLDGTVPMPRATAHDGSLLAALVQLQQPRAPRDPTELAAISATAYRHHHRLRQAAGAPWLDCLDKMALADMDALPSLPEALKRLQDHQWLLVDCLGLALLDALDGVVREAFADWQGGERDFARVDPRTTTDSCYRALAAAGVNHAFEKIDVVDELIHRDFRPFPELTELAVTELKLSLRKCRPRFDPARPLALFADHGFRLSPAGDRYEHGGSSSLERIVPLWTFAPRP